MFFNEAVNDLRLRKASYLSIHDYGVVIGNITPVIDQKSSYPLGLVIILESYSNTLVTFGHNMHIYAKM